MLQLVGLSQLKVDRRVGRLTTVRAERVCQVGARNVKGLKQSRDAGVWQVSTFPNHFPCAQSGERCGTMSDWKVMKGREGKGERDYNVLSVLYNDDVRIFCRAPASFKERFQSVVTATAVASVRRRASASLTIAIFCKLAALSAS